MIKIIKYLLKKIGFEVRRLPQQKIENYFNRDNRHSVLISYITKPFTSGVYYTHTNGFEAIEIAKIFDELNYNVDIIDWNDNNKTTFEEYDLIFGFGKPFELSFYDKNCNAKRLYYGTSCHPLFQIQESLKRLEDCYDIHGVRLVQSARLENFSLLNIAMADAAIVKGNDFVANTYRANYRGIIKNIDTSSIKSCSINLEEKNFADSRKHFIWFGSSGLVHKGLDLVLKVFAQNPHLYLHVCGPVLQDSKFKNVFHKELFNTPNIKLHGFIDIRSLEFENLVRQCAFLIFPSASEGGCAGQVNLMRNGGLIPILTKNAGLDVEQFGFIIENFTLESVQKSIDMTTSPKVNELLLRTQQSFDYAEKYHTLERFRFMLKEHISSFILNF